MTDGPALPASVDRAMIDTAVRREVVETLFRSRPQALVVGAAYAAIFGWMFHGHVSSASLAAWILGMALATAHGLHGWLAFRRARRAPDWDARHFLGVYTRQIWLVGLLIGLSGWMFYLPEAGDARWVVVLLLLSLTTGLIALYGLHLPIYYAWLGLLSAPLALRFLVSGAPGGWVGGALFAFYVLSILQFARRQGRLVQESMRVRHASAALVADLEAATRGLLEANEAKSRFFAAASHDLRQPVQALGYYTELLQPQGGDVQTVDRIRQCVASLDGLLEGVLTLARLDAGKVHKHVFATDLTALVHRMQQLHAGAAVLRGLRLRVRGPAQAWALTDAVLLERVLGNLLANALRYTASGGVLLAVRRRGDHWRVQVTDTGIGIAPEHQARVFDEFVQIGNPQRDASQGVGLGLATVRRLCALLEHALQLRSRPGRGSSFAVDVPACATPHGAAAQPETGVAVPGGLLTGRVLVIEDNPAVRESLQNMLALWGLQCDGCADGDAALALWQPGRYTMVLSDWRLPGAWNGGQLIAALQALPGAASTRFALLTGESEAGIGTLPAGVELLHKPVRPIRLRALLSAVAPV